MTVLDLMRYIKGPDFPSGGTVVGEEGIREYLANGRGRIVHRGTARLEEDQRGRRLIVTEAGGKCCRRPPSDVTARWRGRMWPAARVHSYVLATLPAGGYAGVDLSEVYDFLDRQG